MGSIQYKYKKELYYPIYKYNVSYDANTGCLNFFGDFNPSVLNAPVAAQLGGYLSVLNSFESAFRNMDMYMINKNGKLSAYENRYADSSPSSNPISPRFQSNYFWSYPYSIFERVKFKDNISVNNIMYGSFLGVEHPKELKRGYNLILSPYAGFIGSKQQYSQNSIYQTGGMAGGLLFLYKNNSYMGFTINSGASRAKAQNMFGKDDFTMILAGCALKMGHNFIFSNRYVVQPNFLIGYSFVQSLDYETKSGVKINSDPLSSIVIIPAVKLFANLKNDMQPYLNVSMVFNAIDKAKFYANDISLPYLSLKPFVLYGLGVRKNWDENLFAYIQAYVRNGSRNGAGLGVGFEKLIGG